MIAATTHPSPIKKATRGAVESCSQRLMFWNSKTWNISRDGIQAGQADGDGLAVRDFPQT